MARGGLCGPSPLLAFVRVLCVLRVVQAAGSPEKDHEILLRFRDSITNWDAVKAHGHLQGWDDETPTFLWTGVVLDFDLRVREIKLACFTFMHCHAMEGAMFKDFAQLERLERLDLSGNRFTGELPAEWGAPGAFPALRVLIISQSPVTGTLPPSWGAPGGWPSLVHLSLHGTGLGGTLPPEWGAAAAFPQLQELKLDINAIHGSLPAAWGTAGAFPRLRVLSVSETNITGQLPPSWGSGGGLRELSEIALYGCQLVGTLPAAWASPDRFPRLSSIELHANNVGGSLPAEWGCKGCFPALQEVQLRDNRLTGALPASWAALGMLHTLDISSNRLSGSLPDAWASRGALPQFTALHLAHNRLGGRLPGAWGRPSALPALRWADLSHNNISGPLPDSWGQPDSLTRLYKLELSHNALTGTLPAAWALSTALPLLQTWSLAHNQLTGTLPDAWGSVDGALASLFILDVSHNRLSGTLPPSWGSRPSSLAVLGTIAIAGNNFSGEIPRAWGALPSLTYLMLAPGNTHVCRPLPYSGRFVTCLGEGSECKQPVQVRSNCSSAEPGWEPLASDRARSGLTGLQFGLIASAAALAAACAALAAVLALRWRERRRWRELKAADAELAAPAGKDPLSGAMAAKAARKRDAHAALADSMPPECRIDPADVMFCRGADGKLVQLGSGAYGQVYKAFLHGVHPVAVKVFQTQDEMPVADFWKEISILRMCQHSSIVQLKGACVDGDTVMMVTELMDTDLYRALQSRRVSWYRHGHDIALDVAKALHFLHSRSIIHFDCKSPNILLSHTNQAKLADVGWAQLMCHSYITGDGGTFNWAAPEQLIGLKCTAKADVYSFGLVLWELCTRQVPVRGQIRDVRVPREAPRLVADLIRRCLDVDPAKRPSMDEIVALLTEEKHKEATKLHTVLTPDALGSAGPPRARPHHRGNSTSSSLAGLTDLPGSSLGGSSNQSSAFQADTSSAGETALPGSSGDSWGSSGGGGSGGGPSSQGSGTQQQAAAAAAAGSVNSSLWRAGSSAEAGGSTASRPDSLVSFYGMPVGGSAQAFSGGASHPSHSAHSSAAPPSFDSMPVGAGGYTSAAWHAGFSSGGASGTGGSAGSGSLFAGSPWAAGRPAQAVAAGPAASLFDGSAWAAGQPAAALGAGSHASGSAASAEVSLSAGAGGVFASSPWWAAGTARSSQAGTSDTGSGTAGASLGGSFASSPWWASGGSSGTAGASVATGASGSQDPCIASETDSLLSSQWLGSHTDTHGSA